MCGVFGFVSRNDKPMNLATVQKIAANTMTRGPHAFGFAWVDSKDRLHCFKQTGRITDHLGVLAMAAGAQMMIGHCRFATQGDPRNNLNNHPHPSDAGWIVHNGVISSYQSILHWHNLAPNTDCDSEVLALLIENMDGTLLKRCTRAVNETGRSPLVMLGLWTRPQRMIAVRRGNPLSLGTTKTGYYLASLPDELPGKVTHFKDGEAVEFGDDTATTKATKGAKP